MTDTEINTAIAEKCGWKRGEFVSPLDNRTPLELWRRQDKRLITSATIPNYCTSSSHCAFS